MEHFSFAKEIWIVLIIKLVLLSTVWWFFFRIPESAQTRPPLSVRLLGDHYD